jgi:hypothetical protein
MHGIGVNCHAVFNLKGTTLSTLKGPQSTNSLRTDGDFCHQGQDRNCPKKLRLSIYRYPSSGEKCIFSKKPQSLNNLKHLHLLPPPLSSVGSGWTAPVKFPKQFSDLSKQHHLPTKRHHLHTFSLKVRCGRKVAHITVSICTMFLQIFLQNVLSGLADDTTKIP